MSLEKVQNVFAERERSAIDSPPFMRVARCTGATSEDRQRAPDMFEERQTHADCPATTLPRVAARFLRV